MAKRKTALDRVVSHANFFMDRVELKILLSRDLFTDRLHNVYPTISADKIYPEKSMIEGYAVVFDICHSACPDESPSSQFLL